MLLPILMALLKIVLILFVVIMPIATILTWVERKQSAVMQDRLGANRADILGFRALGLFNILADGIKSFSKEDWVPPFANRFLFNIAPFVGLFAALAPALW
jgi:NADH-quinone oxidoreductase subunit H